MGVAPPGGYEMMERIAETSPRSLARMAGVFYLLMLLTGGRAVFARGAADLLVVGSYIA